MYLFFLLTLCLFFFTNKYNVLFAVGNHNPEEKFLQNVGDWTVLHVAVKSGEPDERFFDLKSLNSWDPNGYTPLHLAVQSQLLNWVSWLVKHEADVNVQTPDGHTPLHYCVKYNYCDLARYLMQHNADTNLPTLHMETPLHEAARYGYVEMLKLLIEYGALINAKNIFHQTPLAISLQYQHPHAACFLLDRTFDLDLSYDLTITLLNYVLELRSTTDTALLHQRIAKVINAIIPTFDQNLSSLLQVMGNFEIQEMHRKLINFLNIIYQFQSLIEASFSNYDMNMFSNVEPFKHLINILTIARETMEARLRPVNRTRNARNVLPIERLMELDTAVPNERVSADVEVNPSLMPQNAMGNELVANSVNTNTMNQDSPLQEGFIPVLLNGDIFYIQSKPKDLGGQPLPSIQSLITEIDGALERFFIYQGSLF